MVTPEQVARQALSLYETYYNDSLDVVTAAWMATEDIPLDDFVTRQITADPQSLEKSWLLPALAIAVGNMVPAEIATQQMVNFYEMEVQIVYYFQDLDSRRLGLIVMRHMEATLDLLNKHPGLDLRGGDVTVSEGPELLPSKVTVTGNSLVKGLLTRFTLRFEQYGF